MTKVTAEGANETLEMSFSTFTYGLAWAKALSKAGYVVTVRYPCP